MRNTSTFFTKTSTFLPFFFRKSKILTIGSTKSRILDMIYTAVSMVVLRKRKSVRDNAEWYYGY